jgi:alpha-maltose-1-phosphate synthase
MRIAMPAAEAPTMGQVQAKVQVTVSAMSRFHSFDLANEMRRRQALSRLYTSYPKTRIEPELRADATTWLPPILATRAALHVPAPMADELRWQALEWYDRWVADRLTAPSAPSVFVALSGMGLRSLRRARALGYHTVCDRGSTHIAVQNGLLAEEHARFDLPYRPIDPRVVGKELAEYDEADLITVPSQFAASSFTASGVASRKIHILPYGTNISLFRRSAPRDRVFRVLFVGTAGLRKGLPYFLEAIRPLASLPDFEVCLIGGAEANAAPFLARYRDHVRDLGFVPRVRLPEHYSRASVLVLPSIEEGFGLVQLQAMACGLPIIATPNTGAADLFTRNQCGFLVGLRDPDAIRERILQLYEDRQLLEDMSQRAVGAMQGIGGLDHYGTLAFDTYTTLVRGTGAARN